MMGTFDCIYETPCGWCSKWDRKCDREISNTHDHQWEPTNSGGSFVGLNGIRTYTTYICKLCGAVKDVID